MSFRWFGELPIGRGGELILDELNSEGVDPDKQFVKALAMILDVGLKKREYRVKFINLLRARAVQLKAREKWKKETEERLFE